MKHSSFILYLFLIASCAQFITSAASAKPTPKRTYSTLLPITNSEIDDEIQQLNTGLGDFYSRAAQGYAIAANFKDQVQQRKQQIANLEAFRTMSLNDRFFHAALETGELSLVDMIINNKSKPSQTRVTIDKLIRSLTGQKSPNQIQGNLRLLEYLLAGYSTRPNHLRLGDHTPALPELVRTLKTDNNTQELLLETIQKADLSWKTRWAIIPYQPDFLLNKILASPQAEADPRS